MKKGILFILILLVYNAAYGITLKMGAFFPVDSKTNDNFKNAPVIYFEEIIKTGIPGEIRLSFGGTKLNGTSFSRYTTPFFYAPIEDTVIASISSENECLYFPVKIEYYRTFERETYPKLLLGAGLAGIYYNEEYKEFFPDQYTGTDTLTSRKDSGVIPALTLCLGAKSSERIAYTLNYTSLFDETDLKSDFSNIELLIRIDF